MLTRDDQPVALAPKPFELLLLLVRHPGRAFSKQELMAALWPETFVEEANLSFQVSTLRKALGDGSSRWIETLPKHGYRFAADVRPVVSPGGSGGDVSLKELVQPTGPARFGPKAFWTAMAVVLVAVAVVMIGRRSYSPGERTGGARAAPLTAYEGVEWAPTLSPTAARSRSPGADRRWQSRHLRQAGRPRRTDSGDDRSQER